MEEKRKIVPHEKFQDFQKIYGHIPAGDKTDLHIIKSRMLQGIYRQERIENTYCNYVFNDSELVNFMRNKRLKQDAQNELKEIQKRNRLTDVKRLTTNLLSSQPMAFNIFLPLRWDNYKVATTAFKKLLPILEIANITDIKLEYVPGDSDSERKVTIDNSCFDVYIEYQNNWNDKCGIGIEVKYTEPFSQSDFRKYVGHKKDRYLNAIKKHSDQFSEKYTALYLSPKFNQLFRNQLLASEVTDKNKEIRNCFLVVQHSKGDTKCIKAIEEFKDILNRPQQFIALTTEALIEKIIELTQENSELKNHFLSVYNRYCNYELVSKYLEKELMK